MKDRFFTEKVERICKRCPYESHPFVPGVGNKKSDLFVICRDPGANEEEKGLPLVGRSGQLHDSCWEEVGIQREELFCSNVVKCRPPDNKAGTKEWKLAAKQCAKYLEYELKKVKPSIIVPMGNEALQFVRKCPGGITQHRGHVYVDEDRGAKIIPTYHPSYIIRNESNLPVFVNDLDVVASERTSSDVVSRGKGYKHTVVDTIAEFKRFYKRAKDRKFFSIDVETNKLEWWHDDSYVICVSFCFENKHSYVIPFRTYNVKVVQVRNRKTNRKRKQKRVYIRPFWSEREFAYIKKYLNILFRKPRSYKDLQNAPFDLHFLMNEGISLKDGDECVNDTLIMQYLVDENAPRDLKTMTAMYAPHMAGFEQEIKAQEDYVHSLVAVKPEILYEYNAGDTVATRLVKKALVPRMREEGVVKLYRRYQIPLMLFLLEVERFGAPIGKAAYRKVKKEVEDNLDEAREDVRELTHKDFNPGSYPQVKKLLYEEMELPVVKRTKTGGAATDEEALTLLMERHNEPILEKILRYRAEQKLHGTYVKGLHTRLDSNWRLHSRFRALTSTGRLSSSNPNLQNIPKSGPIKKMFVAAKGSKIIAADLSQAELRVFSVIAGDTAMQEAFSKGEDFHDSVARMMFGKRTITPEERVVAKTINFSVLFLKLPEAAAEDAGISVKEMQKHFNTFFKRFPMIRRAQKAIPALAIKQGYLTTVFGRKRRFNVDVAQETAGGLNHLKRQAVNFPPQSTASDVNCRAAMRAQKRFKKLGMKTRIIILVHDSILAESPDEEVYKASKIINEELTRPVKELDNTVFPCEIGFGQDWYEAEESVGSLAMTLARAKGLRSKSVRRRAASR